jgi:hypothetical protein
MQTRTIWNGTVAEARELGDILARYCMCGSDSTRRSGCCGPHSMLVSDQRALDGLLFVRHIASRLVQEEFDPRNAGRTSTAAARAAQPR